MHINQVVKRIRMPAIRQKWCRRGGHVVARDMSEWGIAVRGVLHDNAFNEELRTRAGGSAQGLQDLDAFGVWPVVQDGAHEEDRRVLDGLVLQEVDSCAEGKGQ